MAPIGVQGTKVRLYGKEVLLEDYLTAWTRELYKERLLGFDTAHLAEGVHPMTCSAKRSFGAGDCIINSQDMEHVQLDPEFGVQIMRPAVISHYEVATRGRVIRLAKVTVRDLAIDTSFVTTLTD
jgi:hypothetical protein